MLHKDIGKHPKPPVLIHIVNRMLPAARFSLSTWHGHGTSRFFAAVATVAKAEVPSPGGRFIVEEGISGDALKEPILVANVDGTFYAIESTCPHMNKSLEKGRIVDGAEIVCPIHNSRFSLTTGECTKWVTGVMGHESKLVSSLARRVGGEKRDLETFKVVKNDDGSLTIEDNS
jgi:nitrite reductase/ring-hydroxylating ferredoxin subunit